VDARHSEVALLGNSGVSGRSATGFGSLDQKSLGVVARSVGGSARTQSTLSHGIENSFMLNKNNGMKNMAKKLKNILNKLDKTPMLTDTFNRRFLALMAMS
jgi:hypothetical protein